MARSVGQKAARVLELMLALRNPAVASALARFGLGPDDVAQGWALLRGLPSGDIADAAPVAENLLEDLRAWQQLWFPVADAALSARSPDARAMLFANLSRARGPEVILSVGAFVARIDGLGAATRALLDKRGLTRREIARAKTLLARATSLAPGGAGAVDHAARENAERALWTWYLEWSGIARTTIKDPCLLRVCGFGMPGRPSRRDA